MPVVLLALGSRGDVAPMAALAGGLHRAGVPTTVVATTDFAALVEDSGARFEAIPADSADAIALTRTRSGSMLMRTRVGQAVLLRRWVRDLAPGLAQTILQAVRPGDVVLSGVLTRDIATALAAGMDVRAMTVLFTGQLPTGQRESHFAADQFTSWSAYNRWGSRLGWLIAGGLGLPASGLIRDSLGLSRLGARAATAAGDRHPTLIAASPLLVPPAPDWPERSYQTGTPVAPPVPFEPGESLADFLGAGPPPVYIGFGSMGESAGHGDLDVVVAAAALANRRVVTPAVGGIPPGSIGRRVLAVGPTPHDWLFPRLAGVIHHAGAGTTYAGLCAGVPSAAVPFGVDQPYHASRLATLGVGPAPIPIGRLTPVRLAGMLGQLTSGRFDERAAEVGRAARAEDGVRATVDLLAGLRWIPSRGVVASTGRPPGTADAAAT